MKERTGLHAFKGSPLTLVGDGDVKAGDHAPDFTAYKSLTDAVKLSDYRGKTVVISAIPSIDTPVCERQTARFNDEASKLGDNVVVLTVSMDLPPAQARWCAAKDAKNVVMLSDYRGHDFGNKFGLVVKELGLLARAVYVVGPDGVVKFAHIVPELSAEPDYAPVLAAIK
ncbi:MAG: thiol peroxidase [Candidatus Sumerlaeia bacterium]|nr:thiol peroxidase [Candidatus Sumerlaeia bacterium]